MFVQVIQGRVEDGAAFQGRMEAWVADVAPGSVGWLGSTTGVTDDGQVVALARFESAEAAAQNSDRPEQGQWWEGTASVFQSEPSFRNSEWVLTQASGDPGAAGFVQVMQGRTRDAQRMRQIFDDDSVDMSRPDILGQVMCAHADGEWTMAIYFTSEAAAREGEKSEPPPEVAERLQEFWSLAEGEPTFFDLRDPWLYSPA